LIPFSTTNLFFLNKKKKRKKHAKLINGTDHLFIPYTLPRIYLLPAKVIHHRVFLCYDRASQNKEKKDRPEHFKKMSAVNTTLPVTKRQRVIDTSGPWYIGHLAQCIDTVFGNSQHQRELVEVRQRLMMEMIFILGKKYLLNEASRAIVSQLLLHPARVLIQNFLIMHHHSLLASKGIARESTRLVNGFMDYVTSIKTDPRFSLIAKYRLSKAIQREALAVIARYKDPLDSFPAARSSALLQVTYKDDIFCIETRELPLEDMFILL